MSLEHEAWTTSKSLGIQPGTKLVTVQRADWKLIALNCTAIYFKRLENGKILSTTLEFAQ